MNKLFARRSKSVYAHSNNQFHHKTVVNRVSEKNNRNCFCHNFLKFPPILIIFGTKMENSLKLYEVHSFSTSTNSRHKVLPC